MSGMRAFRLALAVIIAFPVLRAVPAYSWHGSGSIIALAIDPQNSAIIYAGTYDRGVFKSIDGGATWTATSLTSTWVTALAIDPHVPSTVYAGTGGGVFKTTDGGGNWNATNSGLTNLHVADLAVDPQTPATLYAVISAPYMETGVTTVLGAGVFKSTDGGATWNIVLSSQTSGGELAIVRGLAIDPQNPVVLYASMYHFIYETEGGLVLKSTDGGASWYCTALCWTGWSPSPFPPMGDLAIAPQTPQNPTTVFAASDYGVVFKSTDGGENWITLTIALVVHDLAIDPQTPTILYAGTNVGVYKSADAGATWSAVNTGLTDSLQAYGLGADVRALVIDPVTPTTLYAGTDLGTFKSTNGGGYWSPTGLFQHSPLSSVSLNPPQVVEGTTSTGTVNLMTAAPVGGVTVTLSSSYPAVATVPASVTIPAGATSATFTVSTSAVDATTLVTISAAFDDLTKSAYLYVTPAIYLSSLSLSPTSVSAGSTSTGTVTLSAPAQAGGEVVNLSSKNTAVATVPASVTVPAGATSANFTVSTSSVLPPTYASIIVAILGANGGVTRYDYLQVTLPPAATLSSVSLNPTSVPSGSTSTGVVTLTASAPAGGAVVTLTSSEPMIVTIPASITVAAGTTSASFTVSAGPLNTCTSAAVTVSGTYNGVTRSADLTIAPATADTINIQQTDYFASKQELRVAAKSSNSSATLRVHVTSTGELIGTLTKGGDGTYRGQFKWPGNPMSITVQSSLCGSATSAVRSK